MNAAGLILSSIGLVLDVIGAILLYLFVMPSQIDDLEERLVTEQSPDTSKLRDHFRKKSKLGFTLLIIGFLLQFVGNLLSAAAC